MLVEMRWQFSVRIPQSEEILLILHIQMRLMRLCHSLHVALNKFKSHINSHILPHHHRLLPSALFGKTMLTVLQGPPCTLEDLMPVHCCTPN